MTAANVRKIVGRAGRLAGLTFPAHPHMLRHTAAHRWLAAGGGESDLMRLMGWRSRSMLERYGSSAATDRAIAAHHRLALGDSV